MGGGFLSIGFQHQRSSRVHLTLYRRYAMYRVRQPMDIFFFLLDSILLINCFPCLSSLTTIVRFGSDHLPLLFSLSHRVYTMTKRDSLNGIWILDKDRGQWSMRGYLETLNVTELAIQAHEKGESDNDTYHTIELDDKQVKIIKRSRVNNDLVVELILGKEHVEYLEPGQRPKKSLATSTDLTQLEITSSLMTMNGMAHVKDSKKLVQEENKSVLVQELTIQNEQTGVSHTTIRYFNPFDGELEPRELEVS